ncbi:DUF2695 domain-containing protein [Isobaculum melis]|uniref:DUF2695 domain-containing protein n=1 Tax=Isobaculum melis TaxID=142588 RepID=A0A1H9PXU7_9LACT|nr:DUF2695 domain-containing protein [Isobaculum melis]SER53027.1 Protein of unknown function [Isobaculum melis]
MLQEWKKQQKLDFEKSLPMSREYFEGLFDYLDIKLEKGCSHNQKLTIEYLQKYELEEERILSWLRDNGGYCDCEILMNVEEKFY